MKTGSQIIADGPLSSEGRAAGKGRSSGKDGIKLNMASCGCAHEMPTPITQRVKKR